MHINDYLRIKTELQKVEVDYLYNKKSKLEESIKAGDFGTNYRSVSEAYDIADLKLDRLHELKEEAS